MIIKNLKARDLYEIKEWELSFCTKNKIHIVEPYKETMNTDEIPFETTFLELLNFLFFNDCYSYAKNIVRENTLVECTIEKDGIEYTFGVKGRGKHAIKDSIVRLSKILDWYCIVPKKELQGEKGGWLGAQLSYEPQEYFYPCVLEEFARFNEDIYADSPKNFIYGEIFGWLKLMAKHNKREVDLEQELKKIINGFETIIIDEQISIGLNDEKEYVFYFYGEELTEQENFDLVNFFGWLNNLNIIKALCEIVGEDGNYPVFLKEKCVVNLAEYKDAIMRELKKTGRQVFIIK